MKSLERILATLESGEAIDIEEMKKKAVEIIKEKLVENCRCDEDIDFQYYLSDFDVESYSDYEELIDAVKEELQEENAFNVEVIYYYKAIDYLSKNDNSLTESLEIAKEYGYDLEGLNSEILASLLASQNAQNSFEIKDFETDFDTFRSIVDTIEELEEK